MLHYRWLELMKDNRSPFPVADTNAALAKMARFLKSQGECIVWTRALSHTGYGNASFFGKQWGTHRLTGTIKFGQIRGRLMVCHTCDVRACINPEHLYLGTAKDNVNDAWARGHKVAVYGERNAVHKVSTEDVNKIRMRIRNGDTQRRVARDFGISSAQVSRIANFQSRVTE